MSRILKKLIVPAVIIAILVISFVFGGSPDTSNETSVVTPDVQVFEEKYDDNMVLHFHRYAEIADYITSNNYTVPEAWGK